MSLSVWARYPHLYYSIPGSKTENPKGMCLCCLKDQKCEYYKNEVDVNYKNLFSHIAKQHPSMLLPEDVEKLVKEDADKADAASLKREVAR